MPRKPPPPPKPFTSTYQPNNHGRPKGSINRRTLVRRLLEELDKESGLTQGEVATLAVLKKAKKGDTNAWDKLMDSGYGKVADENHLTITNPVQVQRIKDGAYNHPDADKPLDGEPGAEPNGSEGSS